MKFPTVIGFLALSVTAASAATLINGDFEAGVDQFVQWPGYVGGTGDAGTNPAEIEGWTGTGGHGINPVVPGGDTDAPFTSPNTWNTTHAAFLQGTASLEQIVTGFSVGTDYMLGIDFNSRGCCGGALPSATILLDGNPIASSVDLFGGDGAVATIEGDQPWYHADIPFTATADEHTVMISTAPAAGGDSTLVIDNITVKPATVIPEPSSAILALLGGLAFGLRRRRH